MFIQIKAIDDLDPMWITIHNLIYNSVLHMLLVEINRQINAN